MFVLSRHEAGFLNGAAAKTFEGFFSNFMILLRSCHRTTRYHFITLYYKSNTRIAANAERIYSNDEPRSFSFPLLKAKLLLSPANYIPYCHGSLTPNIIQVHVPLRKIDKFNVRNRITTLTASHKV